MLKKIIFFKRTYLLILLFSSSFLGYAQSIVIPTINSGFEDCKCEGMAPSIYTSAPVPNNNPSTGPFNDPSGIGAAYPLMNAISRYGYDWLNYFPGVPSGSNFSYFQTRPPSDFWAICNGWLSKSQTSGIEYHTGAPYAKSDAAPFEVWINNNAFGVAGYQPWMDYIETTAEDPASKQFIELNADRQTYVSQAYDTPCAGVFTISFWHRARTRLNNSSGYWSGVDQCQVSAGPDDNNGGSVINVYPVDAAGNQLSPSSSTASDVVGGGWRHYMGTYTVPQGQSRTRFNFAAVNSASGQIIYGNFLDNIKFTGYLGIIGPTDVTLACATSSYITTIAALSSTISLATSSATDSNGNLIAAPLPGTAIQNSDGTSNISLGPFNTNGVYHYAFQTTGCSRVYSLTITVSGNTPPTPIVNAPITVQLGQTVQLTANSPVAGVSYLWTGPSPSGPGGMPFYSTDQNPIITNATLFTAGVYTLVTSSQSGNCPSEPATTTVSVTIPPNSLVGANVCEGSDATLYYKDSVLPGYTYSWLGPNGLPLSASDGWTGLNSITITNSNVTQAMGGVYTLNISTGTAINSITATLIVYQKPLLLVTPVVYG